MFGSNFCYGFFLLEFSGRWFFENSLEFHFFLFWNSHNFIYIFFINNNLFFYLILIRLYFLSSYFTHLFWLLYASLYSSCSFVFVLTKQLIIFTDIILYDFIIYIIIIIIILLSISFNIKKRGNWGILINNGLVGQT